MFITIDCPACDDGAIHLDADMLLNGTSFSCDDCHAAISLAQEGQATLESGLSEFHKLKGKVGKT